MTIEELMYYGRYYTFENEGYHLWWFDPQDSKVYKYEELLKEFGYRSQEEILYIKRFIPLFETDIVALEHEFLAIRGAKIKQLEHAVISDSDFDVEFKKFVEERDLTNAWHDFEYERLYHDAVVWGKENQIKINRIS